MATLVGLKYFFTSCHMESSTALHLVTWSQAQPYMRSSPNVYICGRTHISALLRLQDTRVLRAIFSRPQSCKKAAFRGLPVSSLNSLVFHSFVVVQKSESGLKPQETAESDANGMSNGSYVEADEKTSAEPEQMDEATEAKRQLLVRAAPLAGVWGLERFGLADITTLKLIEALPGVCERP